MGEIYTEMISHWKHGSSPAPHPALPLSLGMPAALLLRHLRSSVHCFLFMTPETVPTFSILAPFHVLRSSSKGIFEEIVVTTRQGRGFMVAAVCLASPSVPQMLWQLLTPVHRTLHVSNSHL